MASPLDETRRRRVLFVAWVAGALAVLLPVRWVGTVVNGVQDCDEVYNYWEAAHLVASFSDDVFSPPQEASVSDAPKVAAAEDTRPLPHRVGFQTWEYAPTFALRSWAFAAPFGFAARYLAGEAVDLAGEAVGEEDSSPGATFRRVRFWCLALPSAMAEALVVGAIRFTSSREGNGPVATIVSLLWFASSAGLFVSSSSLLPSSCALTLALMSHALWLIEFRCFATFCAVIATIWPGWPFVALLFAPFALDSLCRRGWKRVLTWGLASGMLVVVPVASFDAYFYRFSFKELGFKALPLFNVLKYNAGQGGDLLYGVEPWTFYLKNLFLNVGPTPLFSALMLLPIFAPLKKTVHVAPFILWLVVLLSRPHKEERFLYPSYASVYVSAALGLDAACAKVVAGVRSLFNTTEAQRNRQALRIVKVVVKTILAGLVAVPAVCLGASRIAAVAVYYSAPQLETWTEVASLATTYEGPSSSSSLLAHKTKPNVGICVADEWHRYAGTFFLPSNARLHFVEGAFDGHLPRHWDLSSSSLESLSGEDRRQHHSKKSWLARDAASRRDVAAFFNDANREDRTRYVDVAAKCDLAVDLVLKRPRSSSSPDNEPTTAHPTSSRPTLADALARDERASRVEWRRVHAAPFLDAEMTPSLARAFLIPGFSRRRAVFGEMIVRQRFPPRWPLPPQNFTKPTPATSSSSSSKSESSGTTLTDKDEL